MNKIFDEVVDDSNDHSTPHMKPVDRSKIESDDLYTRLGEKLSMNFLSPMMNMQNFSTANPMQASSSSNHMTSRNVHSVWSPEENNAVQTSHLEQLMNDMQVSGATRCGIYSH